VPTIGQGFTTSAVLVMPGTNGSCRCNTSKSSSHTARITRSCADRSGASGATEPLVANGMDAPNGVTPGSGGGPSHGANTRTSWPRRRSALARPSTWPCTPPGTLRL